MSAEQTHHVRILVPVDGSPEAEQAVPYALRLLAPGGEAIVLSVVPETEHDARIGGDPSAPDLRRWTGADAAERAVASFAEETGAGRHLRAEVAIGDPAAQIVRRAEAEGVDLIVMTTQGRGAAGRALFGSVADRVARHGTRPTLLLRTGAGRSVPLRIVVPLDGSERAEQALPLATALAGRLGLPMVLVRVVDLEEILREIRLGRQQLFDEVARSDAYEAARLRLEEATAAYLERIAGALHAEGGDIATVVRTGTPAFVLLDELRPDDLAVMTTHGYGGVQRWLLGSVAEKLVREAAAPVLLVRPSPDSAAPGPAGHASDHQ